MPDRTRYYIIGAFLLGIALNAAYNKQTSTLADRSEVDDSKRRLKQQQELIARFSKINDLDTLKKSLVELGISLDRGAGSIKEGIEGCIGDTPLIKIKSLSEYTGCEILAKAEVHLRKSNK
jgi:cysteine synthase A